MHRTTFAGLTELDPGDPITVDGASFTQRNPSAIDHFLKVGALTHRHDAHAPLANPVGAVAAASAYAASGGQVEANVTLYVAYSLTDTDGGETTFGPAVAVTTPGTLDVPSAGITAVFDSTGGSLPVGQFTYALTLNDDGGGESVLGPAVFIQRPYGYASGRIQLSGLAQELSVGSPGAWQSYNVWRMQDGSNFEIIATNQTADTFTDTGLICTDAARVPPVDMTGVQATNVLTFALPTVASEPALASAAQVNIYVSQDGTFTDACYAFSYPATASGGAAIQMLQLALQQSAPPQTTRAIGGANQINPDTDLLNWTWRRPKPNVGSLPTSGNASGDARVVLNPITVYIWTGSAWQAAAGNRIQVSDQFGASATVGVLSFVGSGGASAALSLSGGSATVTITVPSVAGLTGPAGPAGASGAPGPAGPPGPAGAGGGGGGGALLASAGTASGWASELDFVASGAAQVDYTPVAGGSGLVKITVIPTPGPAGPTGPAGSGSGGSGGPRALDTWATPGLASGWSPSLLASAGASATMDLTSVGRSLLLYQVHTQQPARVRLYTQLSKRAADASRAVGTDPPRNSGLLLELVTDPANLVYDLDPMVIAASTDGSSLGALGSGSTLYASVQNYGSGAAPFNIYLVKYVLEA